MKDPDWHTFSKLVPELRERRLQRANQEVAAILSAPGKTDTERFWDADERMRAEEKILHDCLDHLSRAHFSEKMLIMLGHGLLTETDLQAFSPELRDTLLTLRR